MVKNADRKLIVVGREAQEKLGKGINFAADVVGTTLGNAGKIILIERQFRTPISVDDGYTALNNLIVDDELENLGVMALVDGANHASEVAGDGTSTTTILTRAIYEVGKKLVGDDPLMMGKTPLEIKNEIKKSKDLVIEELNKRAKKIETKEQIKAVSMGAYADEKIADVVAEMVEKVGNNGVIIVEEGWGRETETEILQGMRFAGKLPHGLFANTAEEGLNLENIPILVTDFDFVNLNDLLPLVKEVSSMGEEGLLIVANKYEKQAIDQILRVNIFNLQNRSSFKIHLVRTPSFTPGEFEDLSVFVGAKYFSKEKGDKILEAKHNKDMSHLGRASIFKISKNGDGIILGGAGSQESIKNRIWDLVLKEKDEKVEMIKNRIKQRIASLASSIGIIKVASPSDGETEHIRLKVRNAVKSAQSAREDGTVRGGGLALKEIAESLKPNILTEALKAPYEQIQSNGGGKVEIPDWLEDSVKVVRTALEQACSTAWLLINTSTLIAFRTERDRYDSAQIIANRKEVSVKKKEDDY